MGELDLSPPQMVIRLLMGFISARAIYTAAKLRLVDQIDHAGSTADDLSTLLGADRSGLDRLLRSLTGVGVLRGDSKGRYFSTEIGETLRANSRLRYATTLFMFTSSSTGCSNAFLIACATASPSSKTRLVRRFSLIFSSTRIKRPFSMEAWQIAGALRRRRSWMPTALVGANASQIWEEATAPSCRPLSQHTPSVSGVLLERAPAIEAARRGQGGPLPRCELIEGDYFKSVPAGVDLYIFKRVLFDHSDNEVIKILGNCRAAMRPRSRVLIIEGLAGPMNEPSLAHLMDLTFLLVTTGQMRTREAYDELLRKAGTPLGAVPANTLRRLRARGRFAVVWLQ